MKKLYVFSVILIIAMLFSGTAFALDPVGEYDVIHKEYGGGFEISKAKNGTYNIDCGVLVPQQDRAMSHGFEGMNGKLQGSSITFDVPYHQAKVRVDLTNPKKVVMKVISGSIPWGPEFKYAKN